MAIGLEGLARPLGRAYTFPLLAARRAVVYLLAAALAAAAYVAFAQIENGHFGFPLDDAWIHQVYARNLGLRGEFAFFAGQPSAGSTSPLWAALLAGGYALGIDYRVWTIGLAVLALAGSAGLARSLAYRLGATRLAADWLVPLALIGEWHLMWATVSGMEIALFVLLSLLLFELLLRGAKGYVLGVVAGLLTLTRPEGLAAGALVAGAMSAREFERARGESPRQWLRALKEPIEFAAACGAVLAPYLAFNLVVSGTVLPNTFYAKAQEYAAPGNLFLRWLALFRQPLLGGQILLLPGVLWLGLTLARTRQFDRLVPLGWAAALPALYALRLPVDYQFGRYEMPIIPILIIYGVAGMEAVAPRLIPLARRVIWRVWAGSAALTLVVFLAPGAWQYARSAAIINCEMVATAKWTAAYLPPGAVLAVHDIGAQAYFDSHPLLDLAGLVSPEVIPFIRDESRLARWMVAQGAEYAIFFPSWYPQLAADPRFVKVWQPSCEATHAAGEVDLAVYLIEAPAAGSR